MRSLPSVFARGGTSKGLFFNAADLPIDPQERDVVLCRAMGSPDGYQMQLNGMGGGISSSSKVVFVAPSSETGVDLEYTFGQVAVDQAAIDYSANCGNLTSAVAPFALYQRLVDAADDGPKAFTLRNKNVGSLVTARFPTQQGQYDPFGSPATTIPGVAGEGCAIELAFADPGTIAALPTGEPVNDMAIDGRSIRYSVVFASAPVVFVPAAEFDLDSIQRADRLDGATTFLETLDRIRRQAAVAAGLASSTVLVPLASPKIAMVFEPHEFVTSENEHVSAGAYDIGIQMVSMERPHRSITLTGAMCTAAAATIPGTLVSELARGRGQEIRIGQPAGVMRAGAVVAGNAVQEVSVVRTARLLMSGQVFA